MKRKLLLTLTFYLVLFSVASAQIRFGRSLNPQQERTLDEITYSEPREYEIAEITVSGTEHLNNNALISLSGLEVGDKINVPGPAITNAIKKLWKQGIIGDISIVATKIEGSRIYLEIRLTDLPRITRFSFEGVNSSQESEITDKLTLRGRVATDALVNSTKLTVRRHFQDKGYLNAEVDVQKVKDTLLANSIALKIVVDKNEKVKIHKINFEDNEVISDKKLKGKMKSTHEKVRFTLVQDLFSRLFSFNFKKAKNFITEKEKVSLEDYLHKHVKLNFFSGSKFVKSSFEEDKQSIVNFYNSKGYRDAAIVSDTVYAFGQDKINIDLKIEEGKKYYFRDIIWTGNYVYTDDQLARVLGIQKGDVYDMENLSKRLTFSPANDDITSLYMDYGYLFFDVDPVEVRIDGDSIDVEMVLFEGEQATISDIIIKGNDRTNDHVIRREIRTLPGQKFSRRDLIRTQRELSQLGYFDPEQIGINPLPNPADGTVDIEYTLVERPSDQIELSGGWGGYYGFVGTLGLVFNNFSIRNIPHFDKWRPLPVGDGQKLSLRMQANGPRFQSYSATFSEPWLGGKKPNNFSVGLTHTVSRSINSFTNVSADDALSSIQITSATVGLGRRVRWPDDFFTITNSISYRKYDLYDSDENDIYTGIGVRDFGFANGTSNSVTLNTIIARNSIDQPMFPRSGSSVSLEVNLTPPFSMFNDIDYETAPQAERYKWVEYHKWMIDAKFYTQLAKNLVLESKAHFGFIGSYGDKPVNTPFERFVMGGSGMAGQSFIVARDIIALRGYEDNILTPIDRVNQAQGGVAYNKFTMELRYLVSPNPSATIYVLGFAEGGNTVADFAEYNPFTLYKSAGFGARIFMPAFGLLGIDWGYGFDKINGTVSGPQFHFTIGQQIR